MKLNQLDMVAQCSMEYATRKNRNLTWDKCSEVWHDDDWDIMLTDEQMDELEVVGFTVAGDGIRIRVRLDIECE